MLRIRKSNTTNYINKVGFCTKYNSFEINIKDVIEKDSNIYEKF